jgi:hypothetical protein
MIEDDGQLHTLGLLRPYPQSGAGLIRLASPMDKDRDPAHLKSQSEHTTDNSPCDVFGHRRRFLIEFFRGRRLRHCSELRGRLPHEQMAEGVPLCRPPLLIGCSAENNESASTRRPRV